ncbi:hypothetical protein HW555_011316 [Spodoptera exigua]|uniref:BED-type domain-containing protein n=1 Tax=Spodoptera exigua TaxID=7107 RepID=A0A835G5M8_SPOEX|nr:hypothetical protein HW555_011316 [Spodoptera exigua]
MTNGGQSARLPLPYHFRRKTDAPLQIAREKRAEELSWFKLFPYGRNGLQENRAHSITPLDYCQARIMGADNRFQRHDYLFYALSVMEFYRAKQNIDKEEAKYAICLICKLKVSRGGEGKKAGTSCMKNHLKAKHPDKFSEIYGGSSSCVVPAISTSSTASTCTTASQPSLQKQLTLAETVERKQYWGINDSKSQEFHYLIGEMIALDNEPLSIVDRVGFNRLMQKAVPRYKLPSRTYMTEKIIPDIYDRIIKKIMEKILNAAAVSITSDIWTCDHNNESFLSFTAHWISPDFKLEHGVLAMKPFSGSHTGENIANELNIIAARWNIPFNKIHIIVHDSGANMVKGVQVAEYDSARCFIHSLQRQCIILLKPFEEITKITSSGLSCISEVIPHVAVLMRYIQKEETSRKVPNLLQFLTSLKTQLQQRFEHLDENLKYFLATLLDPRFKTNFFGVIQAEKARQSLLLEGLKLSCGEEDASSNRRVMTQFYWDPTKLYGIMDDFILKLWKENMDIQPCGNVTAVSYYIAKYTSKHEPQDVGQAVKDAVSKVRSCHGDIGRQLFAVSMAILNHRRVSACECAYRLCHLKLRDSSRKVVFVTTHADLMNATIDKNEEQRAHF